MKIHYETEIFLCKRSPALPIRLKGGKIETDQPAREMNLGQPVAV